jgi:hypothetical protein
VQCAAAYSLSPQRPLRSRQSSTSCQVHRLIQSIGVLYERSVRNFEV